MSSIAAMRAAFVSGGSSDGPAAAETCAGAPPFCWAGGGFEGGLERGFEMGVLSGARRTT
jgi:hypothetical protein